MFLKFDHLGFQPKGWWSYFNESEKTIEILDLQNQAAKARNHGSRHEVEGHVPCKFDFLKLKWKIYSNQWLLTILNKTTKHQRCSKTPANRTLVNRSPRPSRRVTIKAWQKQRLAINESYESFGEACWSWPFRKLGSVPPSHCNSPQNRDFLELLAMQRCWLLLNLPKATSYRTGTTYFACAGRIR